MGAYLLRRLLLMVPTLIGITFLVFVLVTAVPGEMSAAVDAGGGGAERARQVALLDDRYGLHDPVLVQYARWLARVSPVRFGARDQVAPDGSLVRPPRELPEPAAWRWFAESLWVAPAESVDAPGATASLAVADKYAARRADLVARDGELRALLRAHGVSADGGSRPQLPDAAWREIERAGLAAIGAFREASVARARFVAVFNARLLTEAGVPLVPGFVSLAVPDLGTSVHSQPVSRVLARALPTTLLINTIAILFAYGIAIPTGLWSGLRARGWIDASSRTVLVALWSVPVVWTGTLTLMFLSGRLRLFPTSGLHSPGAEDLPLLPGSGGMGYALDTAWHLCLPVACLLYPSLAVLSRQARAAVLDNVGSDHVRTARAKGLPESRVISGHVVRNSLIPLITLFVQVFPAMIAGSVIVESVFSLPGMGALMLSAIAERDREVLLANTLLVALVNAGALLLADVLYAVADPRIRFKRGAQG